MATLYQMSREEFDPELTGSLAQSFKEGLILPAERKFNRVEKELAALRELVGADTQKLEQGLEHSVNRLETALAGLKKMLCLCTGLSLLSLAGIIVALVLLLA